MNDGPTPEERVQIETVNHKVRTSLLYGLIGGAIFALAMYLVLR